MRGPKWYGSMEEFEREEIRSDMKLGWSLDDLYAEATPERRQDDSTEEHVKDELDFEE
jgi:hypothetical protein